MARYFEYGDEQTDYLKRRDERLGAVIEQVGHVYRAVDDDLFSSVVHHIIGQQISTKAQRTVWLRLREALGEVTPAAIDAAGRDELQALGMTFRKADYLKGFAAKVESGAFDLDAVRGMSDADATAALCSIEGVGTWTAEMILLFCLQRPDVLSFGDAGIRRGMRMVYGRRDIDRERFERFARRLAPCGSVASLYFWAVSGGAVPGLDDPGAPAAKGRRTAQSA